MDGAAAVGEDEIPSPRRLEPAQYLLRVREGQRPGLAVLGHPVPVDPVHRLRVHTRLGGAVIQHLPAGTGEMRQQILQGQQDAQRPPSPTARSRHMGG